MCGCECVCVCTHHGTELLDPAAVCEERSTTVLYAGAEHKILTLLFVTIQLQQLSMSIEEGQSTFIHVIMDSTYNISILVGPFCHAWLEAV